MTEDTTISPAQRRAADLGLSVMVLIWGLHFIVVKDSFSDFTPLQFNALRFIVGAPFMALFAWQQKVHWRLNRRDFFEMALVSLGGPVAYQVLFALGLERTTATNTALLLATAPLWTAVFSMVMGLVRINQRLVLGGVMALVGVALVILGRGGASLSLTTDDAIGSALLLVAAMMFGIGNVLSKPLVDRTGSQAMTVWKYAFAVLGLSLLAIPDMFTHPVGAFPMNRIPHILYSGVLSGVGGFVAMNFAIKAIGPTRASSYFNLNPVAAAVAGIVLLGEPLTVLLVIGGALTLFGITVVRRNTFIRPPVVRKSGLWTWGTASEHSPAPHK